MDSLEDLAEKAEERGDLLLASQLWKELAERERDPVVFARYGRVMEKLVKWDEAERAFSQALRLDPDFVLAIEATGNLWATRTDKSEIESFQIAKDWFLKALRFERSARTLNFLGATYRALGQDDEARDAFAEAAKLEPDNTETLYNLAIVADKRNREKSKELLEKILGLDPNYHAAHQELGKIYHEEGDLLRAEHHFRRSLEAEPGDQWSLLYLANVLAVQGKKLEAEQTYRLVASLYPKNRDVAEFFAGFLESIGKGGEAQAVRASPALASES
jgi:tetratricopeptide (TPR) repeat protein